MHKISIDIKSANIKVIQCWHKAVLLLERHIGYKLDYSISYKVVDKDKNILHNSAKGKR